MTAWNLATGWMRRAAGPVALALVFAALTAEAQAPGHPLTQPNEERPLPDVLAEADWSPYAAGIGIGVLCWLCFLLSDRPFGVSSAYARTAGMIERLFRGARVEDKDYYQEHPPKVDWEWMLVVGVLVGAYLSAQTSGVLAWEWTPPRWEAAFGAAVGPRILTAVVGGVLIGLGARWAGGCTSGHGISGALQLVASSWLAVICFFVGGVVAAFVIYGLFA